MKKICVLGNFSGRNAGDAAILEGLLNDVYPINPNVTFLIPTINKTFVERTYTQFPIKAIPLMPWNFSLKIFGLPIFKSVLESDLVLLTDAILFDRKLLNPLYNYLSTMAIVLPMAKKRGIPIVLYNVSLGPVTSSLGKICMQRVLDSSELVIVRDNESIDMLTQLNLYRDDLKLGADCALNIPLVPSERLEQIKRDENLLNEKGQCLGFNISSYLDVFVKGEQRGIATEHFIRIIARTMDKITDEMGKKIVFIITKPMDLKIARRVLGNLKYPHGVTLISNETYSHNELAAILSQVEMHVGMRTHSIIFATSSCTPTVAIIATPKNRGYMKTIEQQDRMIEFGDGFSSTNLFELIKETWQNRKHIQKQLGPIMKREKEKARMSSSFLEKYLTL
jgi:polysaccharide pyruvyl transferase WcaK-like protein